MGNSHLMMAVRDGLYLHATLILCAGADLNIVNKSGLTSLMFASEQGCASCVQVPRTAEGDVSQFDSKNSTALMKIKYGEESIGSFGRTL